jgi:hypothetical protein
LQFTIKPATAFSETLIKMIFVAGLQAPLPVIVVLQQSEKMAPPGQCPHYK